MKNKNPSFFHTLTVIALSCALSLAAVKYLGLASSPATPAKPETAFERVMRTNTIRCGYYVFPPIVMRDPNTGEMSGFSIDLMDIIAKKTGLKVEWTEESTFGNWIPALKGKRYDVMCAPMWPDMALGREVLFSTPLYYAEIAPLVRANDTRFDGPDALEKLNQPSTKIVAQDGNMIYYLTQEAFPKATLVTVQASADTAGLMQNIFTGKADTILLDRNAVVEYNKRNDVKLKMLKLDRPLKAQAFSMPIYREDTELLAFMNNAILDLQTSGSIDRLLEKWDPEKVFLPAALLYQPVVKK